MSGKALNLVKPLIESRIKGYNTDVDWHFHSILKNRSTAGDEAVAYLLNVYLGEHPGEELVCEAINRGKRMLSLIREYKRCTPLIGIEPLPDSVQGSGVLPRYAEEGILKGEKCTDDD